MTQLRKGATEGDILPTLANNTLVSISTFANNDFTTILWPRGKEVMIYVTREVTIDVEGKSDIRGQQD